MSEKVTVTKDQARMIENHEQNFKGLIMKRIEKNCPTYLDAMPIEDVLKAIIYGYETEPEYVSFEEAMKAFGEGKKITYHTAGGYYGPIKETTELAYLRPLMFSDLFQTRWTIEEE